MNDHRSPDERDSLLRRLVAVPLGSALTVMPVVMIMGARQTVKSTLVQDHPDLRARSYVSLDDIDILSQARAEPEDVVGRGPR